MNRARPDHQQQAVVAPGHDVVNAAPGLTNHLLDRRARDGKEPDQMLGWGQHSDVLDALVVGLPGAVGGMGIG